MEHITSRQNTHFKQALRLAASARERNRTRLILLAGTRLIGAYASHFGLGSATLLVSEEGARRPEIRSILGAARPRSTFLLSDALFPEISQVETAEGITAIVSAPTVESSVPDEFRILLEGIQDPGNLGGLLRTASAAGATSVHLAKGCADPWSPKSLRGGMGAQFVLPLRERVDLAAAIGGFHGRVIATSPRATQSIYDIDLSGPLALVFGGEGNGLPESVLTVADQLVQIPMDGEVESLNVAAAAAVCCFERLRQRRGRRL
jgi:TrmH family RNA methyltransferase